MGATGTHVKEGFALFLSLKKSGKLPLALAIAVLPFLMAVPRAQAHDFWINASKPSGGVIKAEMGYGHNFPHPEPIAQDRLKLFDALQLITPDGVVKLDQAGENYAFQGKCDLKDGSAMVVGTYLPTFWSKGEGGWSQTDRTQRPDATYCEEVSMHAKTIVGIGGGAEDFVTRPVGQDLEIVPLANPAKVRAGEKFPVQILFDGKPVKTAEVVATFSGFSDREYKAFQGRTDLEGRIDIIPLKAGYWFAKVEHCLDHPDKAKADERIYIATLSFHIDG